jgi:hypothetical protein
MLTIEIAQYHVAVLAPKGNITIWRTPLGLQVPMTHETSLFDPNFAFSLVRGRVVSPPILIRYKQSLYPVNFRQIMCELVG